MKTTIFYVNTAGVMAQWKGEVIAQDETSISIKFSKNKALKFRLKDLDIDFCLVTNTPVKNIGVCCTDNKEIVCFNDDFKNIVLEKTKGNVKSLWTSKGWKKL